ncbi:unnamed protein product [Rotaria sp. Silwood1]|nr:unnamed protein product [Rotaria sp. Silwood1]CAF1570050.1 unnamed protein product [Rotaria sp. Silwood1]CAF3583589.1 unnamed protein product [Rotaria sp. Silwood1]CAF3664070.1 unnamed protein product [Rotaria sp. Silwood1]CAF4707511.1 unnamed protein product [Rotaria sp. Silwood1]
MPLNVTVKFKNECSHVIVVFYGVFKRNANRRPDSERTSSIRFIEFNASQNQLPPLFRRRFIDNLRELDIDIIVARGDADPMIVGLAQDHDAYVVAADTYYHLYDLPRSYVPLKFLNLQRLKEPLYRMNDVFAAMDSSSVALRASLVKYDFVALPDLQKFLSTIQPNGQNNFQSWLDSTESDEQKRQLIAIEWLLLRFIQQVGSTKACVLLIQLVAINKHLIQFL